MARNPVQFQNGVGLNKFLSLYGIADQCFDVLYRWRWPNGFPYLHCDHDKGCQLTSPKLQQCNRCHRQTPITAGTVFDSTKLALGVWFQAIPGNINSAFATPAMRFAPGTAISLRVHRFNRRFDLSGIIPDLPVWS